MAKKKIEEIIAEIARPITDNLSYELVDVEFLKEGANWYLRVYIDKDGGVTLDDCQLVSHQLSDKLDEIDPITQSYFLEVSSPGLDRPLKKEKDFEKFKGELVEVKLFEGINGRKLFEGKLKGLTDGNIIIEDNGQELKFEQTKVAVVRRVIIF